MRTMVAHVVTMSTYKCRGKIPLGLSFLAPFHTYHWPCKPIGDLFFLIATYQGHTYIHTYIHTYFTGLFLHKHMNSLNFC
ncbi:hypothetical protein HanRHA438_Chr10g0459131 [Helianthus annuus]|nr:hypothetical protein HanRHA438_Chr10g0459131 [Helianthus annuus]